MRIAQIVPGVGDTSTCVNCLRDAALIREFRKLGHEVLVVPLVTVQALGDRFPSSASQHNQPQNNNLQSIYPIPIPLSRIF